MRKIIYPGTFDPITLGHSHLIERAAKLFDTVIIAIAQSDRKNPLFNFEQRVALCQQALVDTPNIEIVGFSGLIVDLAKQHQALGVLRGVRGSSDFDYELQMASMNRALDASFETVVLTPRPEYASISSTLVREIASMGGDITQFVHPSIAQALSDKFKA